MDDRNYDNYKYTSSGRGADSRRTDTGRNRRYGDEFDFDDDFDMRSSQKPSRNSADSRKGTASRRREEDDPEFYYDARGVRVKKSRFSKEFLQTLFFFVIPYIVVNTIVFLIVTSTPKITIDPVTTDDYQSTTVHFTISSLLPLDNMIVTLEAESLPYSKDGNSYTALVTTNGSFYVEATSKNGMRDVAYTDIAILDDTPPVIDDSSCHIEEGLLTFNASDTQSGVNWSQIYALDKDGNRHLPKSIDRNTGTVYMPMDVDFLELHVTDMVGNERTANVTATTEQITVKGPVLE